MGVWEAAGEEDSDREIVGGIDEGMVKKRGRVLAICPVVRAPSGQGEKVAPWLTQHVHTYMYAHIKYHTHWSLCTLAQTYTGTHTYGNTQMCTHQRHTNWILKEAHKHTYMCATI